jgi:hypothetical protein
MIKRTVVIVVLGLTVPCLTVFAQTTVCDDSAIMSLKGKWIADFAPRPSPREITNEQYVQIAKRADAVHPLLLEAYPEPVGMQEGRWRHVYGGPGTSGLLAFYYIAGLTEYFCAPSAAPDSVLGRLGAPAKPVYVPGDALTNLQVHFNKLGALLETRSGMTVGGLQVFQRPRPAGTWKGYDLYERESGQIVSTVMLTRKGMLPHRPVTRKEYLDFMIATFRRQYDDSIAAANEILKNPDASRVPEFVEGARRSLADAAKLRDDMSAPFQQALKKHAGDGTLGSPA